MKGWVEKKCEVGGRGSEEGNIANVEWRKYRGR